MEAIARQDGNGQRGGQHQDSRLLELMKKNAYGHGLTIEEFLESLRLIAQPYSSEHQCWICDMHGRSEPAIYDTGVCQAHAHAALMMRR